MGRSHEGRGVDVRLFPPFRLDVRDERLWKGTQELKLRRKPFAILRYLTSHPLRLVTQEELVEAVWGKVAMSESLLRSHVSDLRRAVGEDVIETVVGRGYRFLRAVEAEQQVAPPKEHHASAAASKLVGRSREMGVLQESFERVLSGDRQVVFLMGDPGIGKTALANDFVVRVARPQGALILRGACVEQFGAGEAYLPVLDAVGAICRGPDGSNIIEVLKRHAPTWIAQLPALVSDEALQAVLLRIQGATQARMLRELAEAFDVLAAQQPVVLVLEDMQWSDPSTTDLVAMLGGRREAARVLVLATCRPAELARGDGLAKTIAQLGVHKHAISVDIESWPEACVSDYLSQRLPDSRFPAELPATIRRMTGGNPLFASAVVDDLHSRGMIRFVDDQWVLTADTASVANHLPDTVRKLIDIQIDRLKSDEQRVLEAASIVGVEFVVGAVACALNVPADDIDSACEALANEGRCLQFVATEAWPDGTLQSRYSFSHALYRDAAVARVPAATRRVWHRRIAEGLEASHGEDLEGTSAELAVHFEEARAFGQAVRYHCAAGERAMKRFGRAEALAHFNRARSLVSRLPRSDESERAELRVLRQVGPTVIALRGFQDKDLEQTLDRTFHLAHKLGDDRAALAALLGLQRFHVLQGHLRAVERYDADVASVLARLADPISSAEAAVVSYSARLHRGQLGVARGPLTEACKVLDAAAFSPSRGVNAPVVGLWGTHLVILEWLSGAPDEAVAAAKRTLALATSLGDPLYVSAALAVAALAHRLRREPRRTFELASRALQVSRGAGTPLWQARAMSLYHWAATALEPEAAQIHFEALASGLRPLLESGAYSRPAISLGVVEVFAQAGRAEEAMREIDEALAYVEESDERAWEAELHRLRGDLLKEKHPAEARRAYERAFELAHLQGARSFELRAALSLAKLSRGDKDSSTLEALRRTYATFTEGFETADLMEANGFISEHR
jgi:DNA-binding winged helix-turn-helix (wHTH) protein/tetratricopeptide (TPR) repeat protein